MKDIEDELAQIGDIVSKGLGKISRYPIMLNDLKGNFDLLCKPLNKKTGHCLYWFNASTKEEALTLADSLEKKRIKLKSYMKGQRVVPPRNTNTDSKTIYVGIRRGGQNKDGLTNICSRMNQHFGLYKVGSTQGLQFKYWASSNKTKITLSVIELDLENVEYLNVLEKLVAIKLRPLLGRH